MNWNAIEYAKGEAVEVCSYGWWRGVVVGVHVEPGRPVRYYVQTCEGVSEYAVSQIRRVQG